MQVAGCAFKAASSDVEKARDQFGNKVEAVLLKFDDPATYGAALEGVKRLFMLHQLMGVTNAQLYAFVDAARAAGVEHIVFMAALGSENHPDDPIRQLEQYIINSGVTYTILRPNWFMQNFNGDELRRINEKNQIFLPSGEKRLSLIDTRDIAAVAVKILIDGGHEGQEYALTGEETYSYGDVAALLSTITGREITHLSEPYPDVIKRMRERGVPAEAVNFMEWLFEDIERGLTAEITPHVRNITGRAPIKLDQYITDYADVWKV